MPRSTKSTKTKNSKAKETTKARTKKTSTAKTKQVTAKAIKVNIAKTSITKTVKPIAGKKSDKKIVLDSIAQEEILFTPVSKIKAERGQSKPIVSDKAIASKEASESKETAPQYSFKQAASEKLNQITKNKDVADDIYTGEIKDDANREVAAKEQEKESTNNEETAGKSRSLGLYRKIALSFIVLTVILLAVIAYFSFVKVTITLIPSQERVSSNLILDVFDQDKRSAVSEGEILGAVKQVEVEQIKTYPATDIEVISEEVIGKVILINNYSKNQPLVATTRLLSPDNKLFRIKKTVNVPAGGQLEVEVYADEPGQDMIIGPAHFTIPGLWAGLQDEIYGESKEPMKYSRQVKKYIKQDDIDKAVKDLKQSLLDKATTEVSENYQTYDQAIYDIDNNSISQQIDGKVGDEVEEFTITMKTLVTTVAFMDDEIYKLARQKLISVLPDDKQLSDFSKDDIGYSLNNYNIYQGMASLNINFAGKMIIKQGASIVDREKLIGLNQQQLSAYLDNLPEAASYEIKFYPSFIKKAPSLVDRIELIIMK